MLPVYVASEMLEFYLLSVLVEAGYAAYAQARLEELSQIWEVQDYLKKIEQGVFVGTPRHNLPFHWENQSTQIDA